MSLRIRRGTTTELNTITPEEGELLYTTDTKQLYVGDGIAIGGNPIGGSNLGTGSNGPSNSLVNSTKTAILAANGILTVPGSIIPDTNIAYDLGSPTNRFRDIYLSGNTINLGGSSMSVSDLGQLQINGNDTTVTALANASKTVVLDSDGTVTVSGSIFPDNDDSYDLGSTTNRFQNIYLSSNTIHLGSTTLSVTDLGQLQVNGVDATVNSLANGDNTVVLDSAGVLTVPGSIVPNTDVTYDLGSTTNRFRDIYLSGSTIYLGSTTISVTASGQLQVNGGTTSVDSLVSGTSTLILGADGALAFPNDTLSYAIDTDFSIKTAGGFNTSAVITNAGTGYISNGSSTTTGGHGTGLTVYYTYSRGGSIDTVQILNPGTGYQTGDVLTLTTGNIYGTFATITLTVTPATHNWVFNSLGATTFPGDVKFNSKKLKTYYSGDTLTAETLFIDRNNVNSTTAAIVTASGNIDNVDASTLYIMAGDGYYTDIGNHGHSVGGAVNITSGAGYPSGSVNIKGGSSSWPSGVNIAGGDSVASGQFGGGGVEIVGGNGVDRDGGNVLIKGGKGGGPGTFGLGGGAVYITGGEGASGTAGGDVVINGGAAKGAAGIAGKVSVKTNTTAQGGKEYKWDFDTKGRTTLPVNTAPAHSYGATGDQAGMVAVDSTYIYYCTANYVDDSTDIWKRVALVATAW